MDGTKKGLARQSMKLINRESKIKISSKVAICPYCNGCLIASFDAWIRDDNGNWLADHVILDCGGSLKNHFYMPYVYWLPICREIMTWINDNYRFLDE